MWIRWNKDEQKLTILSRFFQAKKNAASAGRTQNPAARLQQEEGK